MRGVKRLKKLEMSAHYASMRYRNMLVEIDQADYEEKNRRVSYVVIGLSNLYSNFNKAFFLSCARSPIGTQKRRYHCTYIYNNDDAALGIIVQHFKSSAVPKPDGSWKKRDEPSRYDVLHLEYGLIAIGSSKIDDFNIVMGMHLTMLEDLHVFRNYYAHSNRKTQYAARDLLPKYTIPDKHPTLALFDRPFGRAVPLIFDWLDDFDVYVGTLCT